MIGIAVGSETAGIRPSPFQYLIRWYDNRTLSVAGVTQMAGAARCGRGDMFEGRWCALEQCVPASVAISIP